MDAQNMELRWHRKHPSGLVHRYGVSREHQMPQYQGWTEFLKENNGQAAPRIYPILSSDDGVYSCFFKDSIHFEKGQFEVLITGQFHVVGPKASIIAIVGKEVLLSCHLDPVMDAQNMEVRWYREHPSGLVHRYGPSQYHAEQQMPEYKGRTYFLKENINKGQVALRIHSIIPFDEGLYSCYFESNTYNKEAQFEMLVTGSGLAPLIQMEPSNTKEIKLTCTSTEWFPAPEVKWRDMRGQPLAPDSEKKTIQENGLFSVQTSLTVVKKSTGAVSCLIRNPVLSEEKEVRISITDALFTWSSPWIIGLAVPLGILAIILCMHLL